MTDRLFLIDKTAEPTTTTLAVAVQARTLEFNPPVGLADAVVEAGTRVAGVSFCVRGAKGAHAPWSVSEKS